MGKLSRSQVVLGPVGDRTESLYGTRPNPYPSFPTPSIENFVSVVGWVFIYSMSVHFLLKPYVYRIAG